MVGYVVAVAATPSVLGLYAICLLLFSRGALAFLLEDSRLTSPPRRVRAPTRPPTPRVAGRRFIATANLSSRAVVFNFSVGCAGRDAV